ncbi:MAG: hypothetical protein K8L97_28765 [Anaerolineae bacterium]|nr:hypothetical protein [Anaerolineae bacterium]
MTTTTLTTLTTSPLNPLSFATKSLRRNRNRRNPSLMDLTENCELITDNYSGGEIFFRHAAIAAAAAIVP